MSSEIERLRAEVRARQRAANAKISRLRRVKNIDVQGTEYDPRRDLAKIKRYNKKQLNDYLGKLNAFTSRSNQFVAGNRGVPIPASEWSAYKREERLYNNKVATEYGTMKNYHNPDVNMRVGEYDRDMRADRIAAAGKASHRPLSEKDVKASRVTGVEALRILRNDIKKRRNKEYLPEQIAKQRKTARKMLVEIGNPDYLKRLGKMTDHQFDVVFNYMGFAEDVSMRYLAASQGGERSAKDEFAAQTEESNAIDYWFNVAETQIPRNKPRAGSFSVWEPGKKGKGTRRK